MRVKLVEFGGGAHALAIQILGNADDAADAVQDAMTTVLSNPGAYDANKGSFKSWFLRLVRNRSIDQLRKRRQTNNEVEELAEPAPGPERIAEIADRDRLINLALSSLESEQRQIIVLRDYLDLSYAEIARVLDIKAGTVMSRLHRSRLALADAYRKYDEQQN